MDCCLIPRHGLGPDAFGGAVELPLAIIPIHTQASALAAADEQILVAIAIHIKPTDARSALAELMGQERLPRKIVISLFAVHVSEQMAHIFKERSYARESVA